MAVDLAPGDDGTTLLSYDADAVVGGMIGGVGQRLLSSVAERTAGEFFTAVDEVLAGGGAKEAAVTPDAEVVGLMDHGAMVLEPGKAGAWVGAMVSETGRVLATCDSSWPRQSRSRSVCR